MILSGFKSLLPKYSVDQKQTLDWIAEAHVASSGDERLRKLVRRFGCATDRIERRYSVTEGLVLGKSWTEKSKMYADAVDECFARFYSEEAQAPDSLLHVSCTGYVAPSGAQRWVAKSGWGRSTEIIHAYHMGCYAALPSVRIAQGLVHSGKARVDMVHTELCSLHLDPTDHSPEQITVQSLFADGMIRYSMGKDPVRGLKVLTCREEVLPGTESQMSWVIGNEGMRMTLSRDVPESIAGALGGFLERMLAPIGGDLQEWKKAAIFAVHPGGPRIVDRVQELLELSDAQVAASNAVLKERGNMSSATLPHIWMRLLDGEKPAAAGTHVVSLAFGPGLTISGAVFQVVDPA